MTIYLEVLDGHLDKLIAKMRSSLLWAFAQLVYAFDWYCGTAYPSCFRDEFIILDCLIHEDGTDRLSRNFSSPLLTYATWYSTRAEASNLKHWKREVSRFWVFGYHFIWNFCEAFWSTCDILGGQDCVLLARDDVYFGRGVPSTWCHITCMRSSNNNTYVSEICTKLWSILLPVWETETAMCSLVRCVLQCRSSHHLYEELK